MDLLQVFATPMWESQYPLFESHKETFIQAVRKFKKENPEGMLRYNINAYQSPMNMTQVEELSPIYDHCIQMALKASFDLQLVNSDVYLSAAWVNFQDSQSGMQTEHVHQDTFTGVIYLEAPEGSGRLVINNSSFNPLWQGGMLVSNKTKFTADNIRIVPQEGTMLLWPSHLSHSVETNNHDNERISIGFNVVCIPREPVAYTK